MRTLRQFFIIAISLLPAWAAATWYTIGTLKEWRPRIQSALVYIHVEYKEGASSMSRDDEIGATYLIAYLEGIRDGSGYFGALAYDNKYGEDSKFEPENEIDMGFCLEDPYFEIVPKLDRFITEKDYPDDSEFMDILMSFLAAEYPCEEREDGASNDR
jgi:hypothetical protein